MPDYVLVAEGLVTRTDVERAQTLRAERGGTIGAQLIRLGVIEEQILARALARALGLQLLRREGLEGIAREVVALVPAELARGLSAVPLRRDRRGVLVAMADPSDAEAVAALKRALEVPMETAVAPESAIEWALDRYYGTATEENVFLLTRRKGSPALAEGRDTDEQEVVVEGPPTEEMWGIHSDGAKTIEMSTPIAWRRSPSGEDPHAAEGEVSPEAPPPETVIVLDKPKRAPTPGRGRPAVPPAPGPADGADLDHRPTSVFEVVRRERPTEPSEQPPPSMRLVAAQSGVVPAALQAGGAAAGATEQTPPPDDLEADDEETGVRRRRRTTIPGMPAFRAADGSVPGIERVRTTERGEGDSSGAGQQDIRAALKEAIAALRAAHDAPSLAQRALRFVGLVCRRRALLEIVEGELVGWAAAGEGFSAAAVTSLRVPIEISSVFGAVAHSRIPYQGPLLFGPEERAFAEVVGNHPGEIILVPVIAAGDVVALVYGDGLLGYGQLAVLRELAGEIGGALARIRGLE